ncbi:MAG: DNA polymerase III, subunit gamma and tau [Candidatus Solincola sediminis]|uniref:DNA polymerase III subunit gamma/tau n=1 Tax=Candidatus Solincola sediminis TaxID=1797199 RepID=A0A1F2WR77_9ACTN|nr:MAG: DNA polymerase III, subunit gamma and tau [Candidatus Solincola sediminis]
MAYISLYRKWRPSTFEEVIGQKYVTQTLANSLRTGNYSHAYLFAGPRGTGKTSTARILAKALNCVEGPTPTPCNRCTACRSISEGTSVDVIEIDAASNRGIDDIRDLRERIIFSPAAARMKVYILDEAHMLTLQAFNALLKMLEEPPSHVVFVLATTEPHKMPPTILSRCQRFDFRSVPVTLLVEHLARIAADEGVTAGESALRLIARRARGSARDALVIFEQVISYGDGSVDEGAVAGFLGLIEDETLIELGESLAAGNAAGAIRTVERAYEEGRDLAQFAREMQEHFRKVFLLQFSELNPEDLEVDEGTFEGLRKQAKSFTSTRVVHFIQSLRETAKEMQNTSSPRLLLEEVLAVMACSELDTSPQALAVRIESLEAELERLIRRGSDAGAGAIKEKEAFDEEETQDFEIEEAAGPPPAVSAGAPIDLATVRKSWPKVKDRVKEKKITTHAFLLEGKPREVGEGEIVISFPPGRSFHRGELEKEDHKRILEQALEEVLGIELKVRSVLEEEPSQPVDEAGGGEPKERERSRPNPVSAAEPAVEPEVKKTPAHHDSGKVKMVKDIFGAEMIEEIKLKE